MEKDYDKREIASSMILLWSHLTQEQQEQLIEDIRIEHYIRDEVIFSEGDSPVCMYYLLKGKVKISKEGVGGRSQILRMIRPDVFFGFRPYFLGQKFQSSAIANEDSLMVLIPMATIKEFILNNGRLGLLFTEQLSKALGQADSYMVNMTQKHVRGRLAEALLRLKSNYGTELDGETLSLYISREDLASMSNMTTSNAIRTLSTFAAEGIVGIEGKKIKIIHEEQLREISRLG